MMYIIKLVVYITPYSDAIDSLTSFVWDFFYVLLDLVTILYKKNKDMLISFSKLDEVGQLGTIYHKQMSPDVNNSSPMELDQSIRMSVPTSFVQNCNRAKKKFIKALIDN